MDVDGISADVGANHGAHNLTVTDVPDFDGAVPTARDHDVRVVLVELCAENTVLMAGLTSATAHERDFLFSLLLIVDPDGAVSSASDK